MIAFENELTNPLYMFNTYCVENMNLYMHFHESYEICYVLDGSIDIIIDSELYSLGRGDGVILFPRQLHSYDTKEYSKLRMITFLPEFVSEFSDKYKDMLPESSFVGTLDKYIGCVESENLFIRKGLAYCMLGELTRNTGFVPSKSRSESQLLMKIFKYVERNYMHECSLKAAADELSYGYTYLSRMFNRLAHMSYSAYLNKYRINRVVYLLNSGRNIQIQEAAKQCGFDSICSFNRSFRRVMGCTPREMLKRGSGTLNTVKYVENVNK